MEVLMEICATEEKQYSPPLLATLVWFAAYFGARLLLKLDSFTPWERVAISLIPIPFFAWFLWLFVLRMRDTDELQRRIQLESLAIAFPAAIVLLMTLGLLQKAIDLPMKAWSYAHVWLYLPMFYLIGNAIAAHRYR
jgi:hypothetical protein